MIVGARLIRKALQEKKRVLNHENHNPNPLRGGWRGIPVKYP